VVARPPTCYAFYTQAPGGWRTLLVVDAPGTGKLRRGGHPYSPHPPARSCRLCSHLHYWSGCSPHRWRFPLPPAYTTLALDGWLGWTFDRFLPWTTYNLPRFPHGLTSPLPRHAFPVPTGGYHSSGCRRGDEPDSTFTTVGPRGATLYRTYPLGYRTCAFLPRFWTHHTSTRLHLDARLPDVLPQSATGSTHWTLSGHWYTYTDVTGTGRFGHNDWRVALFRVVCSTLRILRRFMPPTDVPTCWLQDRSVCLNTARTLNNADRTTACDYLPPTYTLPAAFGATTPFRHRFPTATALHGVRTPLPPSNNHLPPPLRHSSPHYRHRARPTYRLPPPLPYGRAWTCG